MNVKIKVAKLENGSYMAFAICKPAYFAKAGTPGGVVYAATIGEAYEILKSRLESKGYSVIES